ncbi:Type II secretion system protein E [subsurface metagenome]|nr:type IV-A pilus assembly ATPase PilB [Bacillota bacterium]
MAKGPAIKKKLGDLLVEVGIITAEQLQEALEEGKIRGGRLGETLMGLGYITEDVLLAFLGKQCGVSYVSLSEYGEIDDEVIKSVPESIARHQTLIPIALEGKTLIIAMSDPLNVFAIDDLRLMTGREISVVIASETEIKSAIEKYYGAKSSMEDIVKEMELSVKDEGNVEVVKKTDAGGDDIIALEAAGEEAPIIKIVNLLLTGAVKAGASDVHIEPYEKTLRVRYRIDGVLHEVSSPPKKLQNAVVSRLKIMASLDIAERRLPQDGRIKIRVVNKEIDLRVSVLPTSFGEKVVMRILDASSLCLDLTKLGFEPDALSIYKKNIEVPYGIILVTGPTGSGKSTTLYSTLSTLNYPDRNIITIEDPVEYVLQGINQVQAKADIGLTFAAGLRSFLRQDPDIIMVGEIRDTETAEIAINAALTGHLVFSTLHTNDAPGAMTRLNNMGIEPFLTTSTVIMVIAQRLIRVICKHCKESYEVPTDFLSSIGVKEEEIKSKKKVTLYRGKGCDNCSNTGYRGRIACFEVMEVTDDVKELILNRESTHLIKSKARKSGMITLREAAIRKLLTGVTTVEEVMRVTFADVE